MKDQDEAEETKFPLGDNVQLHRSDSSEAPPHSVGIGEGLETGGCMCEELWVLHLSLTRDVLSDFVTSVASSVQWSGHSCCWFLVSNLFAPLVQDLLEQSLSPCILRFHSDDQSKLDILVNFWAQ
ncbi:hypothetical protein STEG23_007934 [Scotinomys teguina]